MNKLRSADDTIILALKLEFKCESPFEMLIGISKCFAIPHSEEVVPREQINYIRWDKVSL